MRKRTRVGFTMMELMIATVVLLILASVAVAGYQGYRDRAAMLVDETNQKVLAAAVKLYAYDNNALPASLSQLEPRHLDRAFALVTEGKRPYTVLAYLKEWAGMGVAEAEALPPRYYDNNPRVLICPSKSPPSASYRLDAFWADNKPLSALLDPANGGRDLIVEDAYRHLGNSIRVVTTVGGRPRRDPKIIISNGSGGGSYDNTNTGSSGDETPTFQTTTTSQ